MIKKSPCIIGYVIASLMAVHILLQDLLVPFLQIVFAVINGSGVYIFLLLSSILNETTISFIITYLLLTLFWILIIHLFWTRKFWISIFGIVLLFLYFILPILFFFDSNIT